jgi:hypothetical protein
MNAVKAIIEQIDDRSMVLGTMAVVLSTLASLGLLLVG